jgi:hypothetical protein
MMNTGSSNYNNRGEKIYRFNGMANEILFVFFNVYRYNRATLLCG